MLSIDQSVCILAYQQKFFDLRICLGDGEAIFDEYKRLTELGEAEHLGTCKLEGIFSWYRRVGISTKAKMIV